jgi:DNA-directed RNA polymerase subunit RPC12/RpoP
LLPPVEPSSEEPPVKKLVCSPDLPVFPAGRPRPEETPADSSTADKGFRCEVCNKTFAQKNAFQNHAKCHQGKEAEDPYQCNFCGKTFAVPARLTRHYRTHTGEKPYQCEYCKKSFSVKENLSVHRRIHTKERPYKCDICERAFEHSGKLHRHMRIHTGERPHKCAVCNKTFIQSGQLVIHMRTHTGEKPYVCKDCGKGFTCSKQLKVHNRTHTGEKPYSCDICGKSFGYNHVLKLHQVAHYGEKVYKCTICNQTFNSKKPMESHIKSHSEQGHSTTSSPETESSCASSTSDKENKEATPKPDSSAPAPSNSYPDIRELCGYLYRGDKKSSPPSQGLNPALLAAVAVASSESGHFAEYRTNSPGSSPEHLLEVPCFEVTEPPVYLGPDPLAVVPCRKPVLDLPPDYVRLAEEEEDDLLTPPSSNPVSPVPSPSAVEVKEELILPPRKRSKAILKSMESEREISNVRYSSVIHYARAS